MMTKDEILNNLCSYDKKNPMYDFLYGSWEEDYKPIKEKDCYCDNCFSGRTQMAEFILERIFNDKD